MALEPILVERVRHYREENPRLGSVKLWLMLKRQLDETGCFPGRDAFIEMLRRNGLMVRIRRRHHYVTTDFNHNLRKYPNLIKTEWLYHMEPLPEEKCPDTVGRIIAFYNDERPHMSVGYQTPSEAHRQSGEQKRCWKNPWEKPKETEKMPIFDPPNESHDGLRLR